MVASAACMYGAYMLVGMDLKPLLSKIGGRKWWWGEKCQVKCSQKKEKEGDKDNVFCILKGYDTNSTTFQDERQQKPLVLTF